MGPIKTVPALQGTGWMDYTTAPAIADPLLTTLADTTVLRRLDEPREGDAPGGLAFEQLVSDLTASFVSVISRDLDTAIRDAQRQIGEALDLDRVSMFEFRDSDLLLTHNWSRAAE